MSESSYVQLARFTNKLLEGNDVGIKHDQEKIRPELIPPEVIEGLAHLYAVGAKKYGDRNWEKGMSWMRMFGAQMRHAWAWARGETYDPELKTHHQLNSAWNALAIYVYDVRKIGIDDRQINGN